MGRGVSVKKRPVSAAAGAHPPPHPDSTLSSILTCPERGDSEVQSPLRALPRSCWDVWRLGRRAQGEEAGSGASAGISAAAGSRRRPPHAGGVRAADAAPTPRANESGEGAGGEGCGTAGRGGDVPTPAPAGRLRPPGEGRAAASARRGSRGRGPPPCGAQSPSAPALGGHRTLRAGPGTGIRSSGVAAAANKDKGSRG